MRIQAHIVHQVEFAIAGSFVAPVRDVLAIAVKLQHARVHVAVRNVEEIQRRREYDARGLIERVFAVVVSRRALPVAEHHQHSSFRRELDDHVPFHVDAPDVALGIHANAVRGSKQAIAPAPDEVPVAVKLDDRMRAAVEHPDVIVLVHSHT